MKIPYKNVFDKEGKAEVRLGIYGKFYVRVVKDTSGSRFLSVGDHMNGLVITEDRARVLETLLLSLIGDEDEETR